MTHEFDKDYWEQRWRQGGSGVPAAMERNPPNPYLVRGTSGLTPGTALDAGCGAGAEAIWLATQGWLVTAADISADALDRARRRATISGVSEQVRWIEADLTVWSPDTQFDLVTTHYAHPAMAQLDFYDRISAWVAPGGTLLIVGHSSAGHGHHHSPAEASVTVADISAVLDDACWETVSAEEQLRTLPGPAGKTADLRDVVVQATRRS
ncbi:MAG TPA: class I SAM-dependent methyltransferase [Kribbella sp.]|uniref:SAM-dependent methyltransferase n=1 Tax=Kribbella sp. TaxID=1871183 RepID=UPI002D79BD06|nr:class I SAM-dependent methyltransferase [Kribbella sp.]HET6293550.1 class I SAM-dependent methyltransferase [Kribbella sp.]